jgi:hypothetical protein
MHQVYNIEDDLSSDLPEIPSLADLKANYLVLHERRRQVLCVLLAIHVEPYNPAWSTWRAVIRELGGLTRLLSEFTRELQRALADEQRIHLTCPTNKDFEIPQQRSLKPNVTDHARGLNSLSSSIRTLTAKMALLKQDLSTSLTDLPEQSRQSAFDIYDSIGQDLHTLLNDWQSGRTDLIHLLAPETPTEPAESIADSGLGVSVSDTMDYRRKRDSCGDWGVAFPSPTTPELEDIFEEPVVLEGTALGRVSGKMSRMERIEKARREREEGMERRKMMEERSRWMGELKDVLGRRG